MGLVYIMDIRVEGRRPRPPEERDKKERNGIHAGGSKREREKKNREAKTSTTTRDPKDGYVEGEREERKESVYKKDDA